MNINELRKLSLEFRRLSSNFLSSTNDTADVNLSRFVAFINTNETICSIINKKISSIDFDFQNCFNIKGSGWVELCIPIDEAQHIKAQYDYLNFIKNSQGGVLSQAMRYPHSSNKLNDIIQSFIEKAFKPLIDFIIDQISMEMICAEKDAKQSSGSTFIQHIENLNGTANQQGSGTITSHTTNNTSTKEILDLTEKLISSLSDLQGVDVDELESIKDDLESIQEQLKSDTPKKSRLKKACIGVGKFVKDVLSNIAVTYLTDQVTCTDWNMLLQQLRSFIE